ncbi:hypothetical protein GCM10020295_36650 [Streptomyces cinereospinus]
MAPTRRSGEATTRSEAAVPGRCSKPSRRGRVEGLASQSNWPRARRRAYRSTMGGPVGERAAVVPGEDRDRDHRPHRYQLECSGDAGGEQDREQQQTGGGHDDELGGSQAEQHAAPRAVRELDRGRGIGW